MSALPFSISSEAAAWVVELIRKGKQKLERRDLVPALHFYFDYQVKDGEGRVIEWYPNGSFEIGWDRINSATAHGFVEVEILGLKFFAPPDTLERLEGRQIILETVEVGYPTPADKKRQILRAVPKEVSENTSWPADD